MLKPGELLKQRRDAVIDELSDAFADDKLEMAEFERRLALAHQAQEETALASVVADLPKTRVEQGPDDISTMKLAKVSQPPILANVKEAPPQIITVLGSTTRKGHWKPPKELRVNSVLGSAELDFRDAILGPGVTEITIKAIFGSVEITVPPHLAVEVEGTAVLGSFEHVERAPSTPDPDTPILRIRGLACFGSVEVTTRLKPELERTRKLLK